MAVASTTPDGVRRYSPTAEDMTNTEVNEYIEDADEVALRYNDESDFRTGELDDLVRYLSALYIEESADAGEEKVTYEQGSRKATIDRSGGAADVGFLREGVRSNDPSGLILGGRSTERNNASTFFS